MSRNNFKEILSKNSFFIFFSSILLFLTLSNGPKLNLDLIKAKLPIESAGSGKKHPTGVDYYAALSQSFLEGNLYLPEPYHPKLKSIENPYKAKANNPYTIQDAAYFEEKYYLYHGPLPTIFYIIWKILFDYFPSDIIVIKILILFSGLSFIFWTIKKHKNSIPIEYQGLYLILFQFLFFDLSNQLSFYKMFQVHSVARFTSMLIIFIALFNIWSFLTEKKLATNKLLLSVFLSSLICLVKFNFILDATLVYLFAIILILKENLKKNLIFNCSLAYFFPLILSLLYNLLRYDQFFETGVTYLLNGSNFIEKPLFPIPESYLDIFYVIVDRIYQYFFSLPSFSFDQLKFVISNKQLFPLPRPYFTENGVIGIFFCAPIVLIFLILLIKDILNIRVKSFLYNFRSILSNNINLFFGLIILLFLTHFSQILFLIQSTKNKHFEFTPFLGFLIFFYFLNYSKINKRFFVYFSTFSICYTLVLKYFLF